MNRVAPFSSRGLTFGAVVKPDLTAPGTALGTSDPGAAPDGTPAYASVNGTSAAAATVAGSAALLAQARPGLGAADLRSLLVGYARTRRRAADDRRPRRGRRRRVGRGGARRLDLVAELRRVARQGARGADVRRPQRLEPPHRRARHGAGRLRHARDPRASRRSRSCCASGRAAASS